MFLKPFSIDKRRHGNSINRDTCLTNQHRRVPSKLWESHKGCEQLRINTLSQRALLLIPKTILMSVPYSTMSTCNECRCFGVEREIRQRAVVAMTTWGRDLILLLFMRSRTTVPVTI